MSETKKGFMQLHLSVLLAGFTGLFGRLITLNEVDIVWYRMLFTSCILLVFTGLPRVGWRKFLQLCGCGALLGFHWILFYGSIKASNVSIGVICFSLIGFFTALFEPLLFRKRFSWIELLFSLITVAGVLCIFSLDARYRYGILIGVASSAVCALYAICSKKVSVGVRNRTVLMYQMAGGLVVVSAIIPVYLLFFPSQQPVAVVPEGSNLWLMLCHALFCTVGMYLLQIQALKRLSAFTVNLTYNLEPCYTIVLAFLIFGEGREINFSFYLGIALILLSVLLQTAKSLHVSWLPMKQAWLLLALVGLLTACQTAQRTPPSAAGEGGDSAAVYQEWAYQEMFGDSLGRAEQYAYRAFMLSGDSMTERSSLALLSYIYYREGKQQELQLLMQTFSAETYVNMMDVQQQVEQARAGRDRYWYALVILLLLLVTGVVSYWSIRRVRLLSALYRQRTERVRQELLSRASTLTKASAPPAGETQTTASAPPAGDIQTKASALPIDETKLGIDVLYAIINDQNVSQMGKQEEQAVLRTLPMVDATLAALLDKASAPLTPKETFFCIMEYYGKSDRQKARSFCCSEQAIRSTKSRLNRKIDIALLRST